MSAWARLRALPIDLVAFAVIASFIVITHLPFIGHGMVWNDASWYFHFGNRTLHGAVPYRDYVFQVGPLPIYVDAAFQEIFGEKYLASMYAGMFLKILRVHVVWMIVRRLAGARVAGLVAAFCTLDLLFSGWPHNWSTQYSQLFFLLSALFVVIAVQASELQRAERVVLRYLACAGFAAGLVLSARQATAITLAGVIGGATTILLVRREWFTVRRFAALWTGFVAAVLLLVVILAALGALGAAIQQLFIDAPQKKGVSGVFAVLDAVSGGALVVWGMPWWRGVFVFLGIAIAITALVLFALSRRGSATTGQVAILAIPIALVLGMVSRHGLLLHFFDLPRTFLTVVVLIALAFPARLRLWFGLEPVLAVALAGMPLASDWALEMSYPGRGWGDPCSLVPCTLLLLLASRALSRRVKVCIAAAFALAGAVHVAVLLGDGRSPVARYEASEGTLQQTQATFDHPMLRGMRISEQRRELLRWLTREVRPGSTCFMYGTIAVVYELLDCANPTRIDVTIPDFVAHRDAIAAIKTLLANPPDFIIAQESSWMNPSLEIEVHGNFSEMNPRASRTLHSGLRKLLRQYESVGFSGEVLGPALAAEAARYWDSTHAVRLYRRRP